MISKEATKNLTQLWFKICWKWVSISIQHKRKTKLTSQSNYTSWTSTYETLANCGIVFMVLCVLYEEVVWIQNFIVKVQSQLVYRPVFSHFPYGCQFLNQSVFCYNMGGTFTDNCMHCKVWFIYLVCPINL